MCVCVALHALALVINIEARVHVCVWHYMHFTIISF